MVLVKDDGQWYRGRCIDYSEDTRFEIFLVDFGYTVTKRLKDLREMKEDFTYLPFQVDLGFVEIVCFLFLLGGGVRFTRLSTETECVVDLDEVVF